jgi:asparagine synthase (glutamine-hydrolysing)
MANIVGRCPSMKLSLPNIKLQLSDGNNEIPSAYPWTQVGNVLVKGYMYSGNKLLTGTEFGRKFENVRSRTDLIRALQDIVGFYAVIISTDNYVLAAVDRVASTPLLFRQSSCLEIGDDFQHILKRGDTFNELGVLQYLTSGYVFGNQTLLEGIQQICAGDVLEFNKSSRTTVTENYYSYIQDQNIRERPTEELINELHSVHLKIFERMVETLDGRQAVVPLSGGYDSRLIVEMLHNFSYKNVLCVTWGRADYWQVGIARDVAESLGYQWALIDSSPEDWRKWYNSGAFGNELCMCGALASIPYVQDNLIFNNLYQLGLLQSDAIMISGNSGDFIEGDHILALEDPEDSEGLLQLLESKHMRLSTVQKANEARSAIELELVKFRNLFGTIQGFDEFWEWRERQSKFVSKSIKPFEAKGFEWRMPFWDYELMEFWRGVPRQQKAARKLFYEYATKKMAQSVQKANPPVSLGQRYYDALIDGRFGCYDSTKSIFSRLLASNRSVGGFSQSSELVSKRPLRLTRFNGLLALDVCSQIEKRVRS